MNSTLTNREIGVTQLSRPLRTQKDLAYMAMFNECGAIKEPYCGGIGVLGPPDMGQRSAKDIAMAKVFGCKCESGGCNEAFSGRVTHEKYCPANQACGGCQYAKTSDDPYNPLSTMVKMAYMS